MMMRNRTMAGSLFFSAVLVGLLLSVLVFYNGQAAGEPPHVSTQSSNTVTFHTAAITQSQTTNTASPLSSAGQANAELVDGFTSADVFVSTVFSGTGAITVTAQFSADGVNWADSTFNWAEADSLETGIHRVIHTGAGSTLLRLPVAGQRMRFSMVTTDLGANERITPTIRVTLRN